MTTLSNIITPSNVLTTTNTATVTNKTLTSPTVTGMVVSDATANGVFYANGSKVLTSGSALQFDGTNLGLGNAPASWNTITALQVKNGSFGGYSSTAYMGTNWYYASGDKYITSTGAALYAADGNLSSHTWYTASGGTAGNAITWTQSLQFAKGATLALEGATTQTGTGITFPATQLASSNANTLDDYEEGTYTATPIATEGGSNFTVTSAAAGYTKIGNIVHAWGSVTYSAKGSGSLFIVPLPFIPNTNGGNVQGFGGVQDSSAPYGINSMHWMQYSAATIFGKFTTASGNYFTNTSSLPATGTLTWNVTYKVD